MFGLPFKFVNLNGEPVEIANLLDKQRRENYIRREVLPAPRTPVKKNGYAAPPGTGPEGMTCKQCEHKRTVSTGCKTFPKCALREATWTHGPGTDILASSPACSKFQQKTKEQTK